MRAIELVTIDYLKTVSAVTAIVSTRIRQLKLKQNETYPALRVQVITDERFHHLRGTVNLNRARLQVDAYNTETAPAGVDPYTVVADLAAAVETALDGVRFTVGDVHVTGAFQILRRALSEPGTQPLIRVQQDFRFRFKRVS